MARNRQKDFNYVTGKKYDGMMGRCYRESDRSYKNYGAKNVRVSETWIKDINTFRVWIVSELSRIGISLEDFVANSRYFQLDRINPDGHYTPNNCRLTGMQHNSRNKRINSTQKYISAEGNTVIVGESTNYKEDLNKFTKIKAVK